METPPVSGNEPLLELACLQFRREIAEEQVDGTIPIDRSIVGGELGSTGQLNGKWRVVVGQRATLKADQ